MDADLLVVGAGPAGLTAALTAARRGLKVIVVDEFFRPGGRLLGQMHQEPDGHWFNGLAEAETLALAAANAGVQVLCGLQVWGLERLEPGAAAPSGAPGAPAAAGWRLRLAGPGPRTLEAPALLLATGAAERPLPLPGWELPGVFSIGGAQVLTNVHRVRPGRRVAVVGVGVLSMAITRELVLAGVEVTGIYPPAPGPLTGAAADRAAVVAGLGRLSRAAPGLALRMAGAVAARWPRLAAALYPRCGVRVWGIPVHLHRRVAEILGQEQVEGVRFEDGSTLAVDAVCLAGGLYPLAELAGVTGCRFAHIPALGGHVPLHGPDLQTNLPGLWVAGNITGVEGAKVAMAQGRLAGEAIAAAAGRTTAGAVARAREEVDQVRAGALIQFDPRVAEGRAELARRWAAWQQEQSATGA